MTHRALPLLALAAACSPAADTWDNGGATADGSCQPQADNALRFDCDLATGADGTVTLEVSGPDGDFTVSGAGDLSLVGLEPDATYTWVALADGEEIDAGSVTTGVLPSAFDDLSLSVAGSAGPDATMIPVMCDGTGMAVAVGSAGEVLWYEPLEISSDDPAGGISGFHVTPDNTVLVHLDNERVLEVGLDGSALLDVSGLEHPLHHDLSRDAAGRTYALFAEEGTLDGESVILDGFYVLDPGGDLIGTWSVADHLATVPNGAEGDMFWSGTFPGASDITHANAVSATDDGEVIVSFKAISTVARVAADPDAADFGELLDVIDAGGTGALPGTLDIASGGFSDQHHAHLGDDGALWMFDNSGGSSSAAEVYDLTSSTATLRASYSVGATCPRQGSAFELDDGSVLAACADEGTVMAFDEGASSARWTLTASCGASSTGMGGGGGGMPVFARAAPISLH